MDKRKGQSAGNTLATMGDGAGGAFPSAFILSQSDEARQGALSDRDASGWTEALMALRTPRKRKPRQVKAFSEDDELRRAESERQSDVLELAMFLRACSDLLLEQLSDEIGGRR
jgi:hypothetical protein